ncbi:beta-phosphoglucomutase [Rufibacter glacialis]|uniref:Beta-phosphoglucomutase n=1 Tax=Rufibacter glacialis TaxID=1259555 RepID=A0A5M8Q761_9BACT|nr:beta-phosphoglucomutase [Rufibacter glacialis]KAA6431727.1 beta-phosphoglucomutase [Rufibacter glacialis]GGK82110.1 beta-phosphoglucomutase [Rufibacter glacialis]
MSPIKACLFDLDGVLVDTAVYHFKAWRQLAQSLGIDFTEHDNERLKGVSRVRSLEIILEIGGKTLPQEQILALCEQKNSEYLLDVAKMTPEEILPGVVDFLQALKAEGLKIALGSASKNAQLILERTQLLPYFEAIIDGRHVVNGKPDPEVFLKGAEALGVLPEECVVFEDALAGVEAAKNGGMLCVGVGQPEVLTLADIVVKDLTEMSVERLHSLAQKG